MRYLGIDYGGKRVGIAVSDETKTFANPLVVLQNNEELISKIKEICTQQEVEFIVVGESKDFDFKDNEIMKEIKPFIESLKLNINVPIEMHPEFLTSKQAEHIQGKNDMHDASAGALILQSFLDTKNNHGK
jgi:putative holliday junction resolvase